MAIKCPNCGTEFYEGFYDIGIAHKHPNGDCTLIPKEIHNDNIERINKENKNTTNNTEKKEEENTMTTMNRENTKGNTTMGGNLDMFTMDTLAQMVAEYINTKAETVAETHKATKENGTPIKTTITSGVEDKNGWAKTSKYYGKTIAGQAFNPYMIRFWIVRQFNELMRVYNYNVHKGIADCYDYMWSIDYVLNKEVSKLAMLEKRDKIAFEERSKVFDLGSCKQIFIEYIDNVIATLDKEIEQFNYSSNVGKTLESGIKGYGWIKWGYVKEEIYKSRFRSHIVTVFEKSDELKLVYANLNNMKFRIQRCWSYKELYETMKGMKLIKVSKKTKKSKSFMDCFIKAGAYYTLKYMLLFDETVCFKGHYGEKGVDLLRHYLNIGEPGYVIYAMLKEVKGII